MKGYVYARMWQCFAEEDSVSIDPHSFPWLFGQFQMGKEEEVLPIDRSVGYLVCIGQTSTSVKERYKDDKSPPPNWQWKSTVSNPRRQEDLLRSSLKMFLSNKSLYAVYDKNLEIHYSQLNSSYMLTRSDYSYEVDHPAFSEITDEFKSRLRKQPWLFKLAKQLSNDKFHIPYRSFPTPLTFFNVNYGEPEPGSGRKPQNTLLRPIQEILICTFFDAYFGALQACAPSDHRQMSIIE